MTKPIPRISAEFALTAACCAWPPTERFDERIRAATEAGIDWNRMLRNVSRHRVAGLVHDGLTRARVTIPRDFAQAIANEARAILHSNLAAAAESVRLKRMFEDANISLIFIKGSTLGLLAYQRIGLRHSKDIDVVVAPRHVSEAGVILERAGYRRIEPTPTLSEAGLNRFSILRKDFAYLHSKKQIEVELHWRLFDNRFLMPDIPAKARTRSVRVGETMLSTLTEDDLFAYLCLHGALTGWFRLKWLADIGALLTQTPAGGVERLYDTSAKRGAGEAVAQAILLCRRLLGTDIPEPLLAKLHANRNAKALERTAMWALTLGHEEKEPSDVFLGGMRVNLSHLRLRSDRRYRADEIKNYLIAPDDLELLPLPKGLLFLYPILRLPLWLLRQGLKRSHWE